MVDVIIGKVGIPESNMVLEFDGFTDASKFCELVKKHYVEERKMLYMAIDRTKEFEALEEVFSNEEYERNEIDEDAWRKICEQHAQASV